MNRQNGEGRVLLALIGLGFLEPGWRGVLLVSDHLSISVQEVSVTNVLRQVLVPCLLTVPLKAIQDRSTVVVPVGAQNDTETGVTESFEDARHVSLYNVRLSIGNSCESENCNCG